MFLIDFSDIPKVLTQNMKLEKTGSLIPTKIPLLKKIERKATKSSSCTNTFMEAVDISNVLNKIKFQAEVKPAVVLIKEQPNLQERLITAKDSITKENNFEIIPKKLDEITTKNAKSG